MLQKQQRICGRQFSTQEVALIQEVVASCAGISRYELAHTICELLNWKRPTGRLKWTEGLQRHGAQVKTVMVYPLVKNARLRLTKG